MISGYQFNNFCCPDKNADIVFSLRLLGLYGFSLINEEQRSFAKSSFEIFSRFLSPKLCH